MKRSLQIILACFFIFLNATDVRASCRLIKQLGFYSVFIPAITFPAGFTGDSKSARRNPISPPPWPHSAFSLFRTGGRNAHASASQPALNNLCSSPSILLRYNNKNVGSLF
jgi:hypothetical protein